MDDIKQGQVKQQKEMVEFKKQVKEQHDDVLDTLKGFGSALQVTGIMDQAKEI